MPRYIKSIKLFWHSFSEYKGDTYLKKSKNALKDISRKTGVLYSIDIDKYDSNFYKVVIFRDNRLSVEKAYVLLLTRCIKSLYWEYSKHVYENLYFGLSDSEPSENNKTKCKLCGTVKSLETPFEITKCRNLDISIIDNKIAKMKHNLILFYNNSDDRLICFDTILEKLIQFFEIFSKWCNFSRLFWEDFKGLLFCIGDINKVGKLDLDQTCRLNRALVDFKDNLETAFLSID